MESEYSRDDPIINELIDKIEDDNRIIGLNDNDKKNLTNSIKNYINSYNSLIEQKCKNEYSNYMKSKQNELEFNLLDKCTEGKASAIKFLTTLDNIANNIIYYKENYCIKECINDSFNANKDCISICIKHSYFVEKAFDKVMYDLINSKY